MATGDGLLVRVHPPGGVLGAEQVRTLAAAARRHGNGLADVTGRGNLQLRGVGAETHPALAADLARAGLADPRPGAGPQRLTLAAPLAGLDPAEPLDAAALAAAIEALAPDGLPPKTLVAVESGTRLDPRADLRLAALGPDRLALGLAGPSGTEWVGTLAADDAPAAAERILSGLAASGARRLRDLDAAARRALAAGLGPPEAPPPGHPLEPGIVDLKPGRAVVLELPFGRADAALLEAAAEWAERFGDGRARLTHRRGLAFAGLDPAGAAALAAGARAAGLILDPVDPRRRVAACPGAPACARGSTPTGADAARLAGEAARLGIAVHVSGCAKGCAHPEPAALTLVGEGGRYRLVTGGRASDPASAPAAFAAILDALARTDHPSRLADLLG
jgi:precorrin-3B synthase